MIGHLAVSFCDRKPGQTSGCLDLWSYPDGSYNLVMENFGGEGTRELAFPCALHQLAGPLHQKNFVSQTEEGILEIGRCGDTICAEFNPFDGRGKFRHCIGFEEYEAAISALEAS